MEIRPFESEDDDGALDEDFYVYVLPLIDLPDKGGAPSLDAYVNAFLSKVEGLLCTPISGVHFGRASIDLERGGLSVFIPVQISAAKGSDLAAAVAKNRGLREGRAVDDEMLGREGEDFLKQAFAAEGFHFNLMVTVAD